MGTSLLCQSTDQLEGPGKPTTLTAISLLTGFEMLKHQLLWNFSLAHASDCCLVGCKEQAEGPRQHLLACLAQSEPLQQLSRIATPSVIWQREELC